MVWKNDVIVVWFSSGAASAVAAKKTIEKYKNIATIRIVNNPIKEEHSDNLRFLKDVEKWLGVEIEFAINDKYKECSAVDVWKKRKFMSGPSGAPCTTELKRNARSQWEQQNKFDWLVLGFTYEEKQRSDNFILGERSNLLPILIEEKITKKVCFDILREANVKIPEIYILGYPNANCIGCVKASSPTYWNHVRKIHPDIFNERAKQSREIGAKLVRVKNKRIYLDELSIDAFGASMKNINIECGIFCEEKW
jgi:3'-phosphoadenosine 5'-phosphosulfate sulfotransferase (PAPS reductase)/FAD synthetase